MKAEKTYLSGYDFSAFLLFMRLRLATYRENALMLMGNPTSLFGWPVPWSALCRAFPILLSVCLVVGDPVAVLALGRTTFPEHEEEQHAGVHRAHLLEARTEGDRPLLSGERSAGRAAPFASSLSSGRPSPVRHPVHTFSRQPGSIGAGAFLRC